MQLAEAEIVPLSRVPLTAVPQRTALSHAFGGIAAGLVGTAAGVTDASGSGNDGEDQKSPDRRSSGRDPERRAFGRRRGCALTRRAPRCRRHRGRR